METLNLFEKIQKVSEEVMNIEKDMTVGSGSWSYKAVSDVEVTLRVKKAEIKHRIVSIPIKQELISHEIVKSMKGDKEILTHIDNIKMTVKIIDLDCIADFIEIESLGKGIDSGDKGFGKASTYARKYALLNAYKIATGEDPDSEKSNDLSPITSDKKREEVVSVCLKNTDVKNNVLSHFNLGSLDDFSDDQIKTIHGQFTTKKLL